MHRKIAATVAFVIVLGRSGADAMAQSDPRAVADGRSGGIPIIAVTPGTGRSVTLKAFSEQLAPVHLGPNDQTAGTGSGGGAAGLPNEHITVGIPGEGLATLRVFQPPVGVVNAVKANGTVTSTSGAVFGEATFMINAPGPGGSLSAQAFVPDPPVAGKAAAEAIDPYSIQPGSYTHYGFTINSAELLPGLPGNFSGIDCFADDSRFTTPLWYLGVVATKPLISTADLTISFTSNPILGLDDGLVASQLRNAFTVSGGDATLSSYTLFDTTYIVDTPTIYSDGVGAGVQSSVPEPHSITLAALALLCLGAYAWITSRAGIVAPSGVGQ